MAYKYYSGTIFKVTTPDNKELFFTCFGQGTSYGFRHVCFKGKVLLPDMKKPISKRSYYNRTWERYQFESVLEGAMESLDYKLSDCKVEVYSYN